MLRSLYSKLAVVLFVILCLFGLLFIQLLQYASEQYQQEVTQRLNETLADHVIAELDFFHDKKINQQALKETLHMMMVINPNIEVYLLDNQGQILGYAAANAKIKRSQVAIEPIKKFLNKQASFPLKGDDPRDPAGRKVFSVAPISNDDQVQQGYLYIILGGEEYAGVAGMLKDSYILRLMIWGVILSIVIASLVGLMVFALMTKRLRKLTTKMSVSVANQEFTELDLKQNKHGDEVQQLALQFNSLIKTINSQIEELRNVDKVRRDLIANVSHDLRTPVTTLQGYLETLLLKKASLSEQERDDYLKISINHSKQLSRLITELFELAKLDSCETIISAEPFSLAELIQDVVQKFTLPAREKGITLTYQYQNQPGQVFGDIGMMQRALENLIQNALRHTEQGGTVKITVKTTDDKVIVVVSDNGCGIPKTELSQIFNRFYRLDKSRTTHSAGLGLAITKRILELHGSEINVESRVNHGTTFSFQIPAYTKQKPALPLQTM
jgi:signal transduction histidine kinase